VVFGVAKVPKRTKMAIGRQHIVSPTSVQYHLFIVTIGHIL